MTPKYLAPMVQGIAITAFVVGVGSLSLAEGSDSQPTSQPTSQTTETTNNNEELLAFQVEINSPAFTPMIESGVTAINGDPIGVSCGTCHSLRGEATMAQTVAELDVFHQDLVMAHGDLKCAACHEQDNDQNLRLADGTILDFDQSMQLCAQCHGPQYRDYQNGSHGGMTGHWDLNVGGRQRNHCIDCHDPHAPAYPQVMPVFPPQDRFLIDSEQGGTHE